MVAKLTEKRFNEFFPKNTEHLSMAQRVGLLPRAERRYILNHFDADALLNDWNFWSRPAQQYPLGVWSYWLVLAGRGFGKTRIGAETVRMWSNIKTSRPERIALIGATQADVRDVMVDGESGLLAVFPNGQRPEYEKAKGRITFKNGSIATMYSAEKADRLRGPQHSKGWCDELAAWKRAETWDMFLFGLRLGQDPRAIITTTPKPTKLIKELVKDKNVIRTSGSTYDNSGNLAPKFIETIVQKFEGTRLGDQELHAKLLDDVQGALWTSEMIYDCHVETHPDLVKIVVAIDPAITATSDSDETGIIAGGLGVDGKVYILKDLTCKLSPNGWGQRAVNLYYELKADIIIAEVNQGGDMVETIIKNIDNNISYNSVWAKRGKIIRAQPVSALYEQGKVKHVVGPQVANERNTDLELLEEQLKTYNPLDFDGSPDRLDALVYVVTELLIDDSGGASIRRL